MNCESSLEGGSTDDIFERNHEHGLLYAERVNVKAGHL
jgi:hypothetical protein